MIQKAIAVVVLAVFFVLMFMGKKNRNTLYIGFVLVAFPFMGIDLMPSIFSFRIFDFILLFFLLFFYQKRQKLDSYRRTNPIFFLSFLSLIAIFLLNAFLGSELNSTFYGSALQLITVAIFTKIVFDEFVYDEDIVYKVLPWLRLMLVFSFLFLMTQFWFGTSFTFSKSPNINVDGGIVTRYPSYFQDPQKYAQFLAALSFPLLLSDRNGNTISFQGICLFALAFIALLYTGGRAALLGWVIGVIFLLVFMSKRFRLVLSVLLMAMLYTCFVFQDRIPILKRASVTDSYAFRNEIWLDAYKIFLNYPVTGIGFGEYSSFVAIHNPDQYWIADNEVTYFDHPESGYLKLLVEFGLVGFIPLVILMIYPIIMGFQYHYKHRNTLSLMFSISLITWMIGFATVYSLGDIRIVILIVTISAYLVSLHSPNKVTFHDKRS
jgi:O-antigen ligase